MSEGTQIGEVVVGDDAKLFVASIETPCPCCGYTGAPVSRGNVTGRRINADIDVNTMDLAQLTREIINSSSCYCKAKARGAVELMEVSKARMDVAKAAKALLNTDVDAEKEARKAQVAAEKETAKAAAKEAKDKAAADKKALAETAKVEAKAVKDAAIEAAKAKMATVSTGEVIIEDGGL